MCVGIRKKVPERCRGHPTTFWCWFSGVEQVLNLGQASLVLYIVIVVSIAIFIVYWKSHAVAKALQLPMH